MYCFLRSLVQRFLPSLGLAEQPPRAKLVTPPKVLLAVRSELLEKGMLSAWGWWEE
jgi:hypothetical protein